jgi:Leucine-rich repeat (LRR) protein
MKTLDITNNDLIDLPSELGFLPNLIRISLEGNPLKSIKSSLK